jgi:tRNA(fMet)-specific endonuclease VapC
MNGDRVALDTNIAVAVPNDDPVTLRWLGSFAELGLPVVVIGELRFGARNSAQVAENLARVDRLMSRCRVLDITRSTADVYSRARLELKRSGQPVPENDLWIAAICLDLRLPLARLDRHFSPVSGLSIVHA